MHTLGEIADLIGAAVPDSRRGAPVEGIGAPEEPSRGRIVFVLHEKYLRHLAGTQAAAVFVSSPMLSAAQGQAGPEIVVLGVPDAGAAMQRVLEHLSPPISRPAAGTDATALVAASARLGAGVAIGPHAVIGEHTRLGRNVTLHAGVVIGEDVSIGDDCELFAGVVVRERCTLGNRVTIHANSVIGTDGFGYRWDGVRHAKLPHIGTVAIEDDVEIGSCSCVDRGKIGETRVGAGTKLDNLVQVGHNVRIGRNCILCAHAAVGGTAVLGDGVILGGGAAVRDHARLGKGAQVAAFTAVPNDVAEGEIVLGVPAVPQREFLREQGALRKLPELAKTVRALTKRVEELEARAKPGQQPDVPRV